MVTGARFVASLLRLLDPRSWKKHTEHLPLGRSLRTNHDCGEGRTLKVSHKTEGFDAWCWRCNDGGFIANTLSLAQRIERLQQMRCAGAEAVGSVELPLPAEYDPQKWPDYASVWLYKAGISNDDVTALRFYYCSRLDRVVMPLFVEGELVYWQARGFDKRIAKYINPMVDRDKLLFKAGRGPVLVLTEDIISAYKVGKVSEAWALMGTSISDSLLAQIAGCGKPIRIMLDPDAGGEAGRRKALRKLRMLGCDVQIVHAQRDPKLLSLANIRELLQLGTT